MSRSTEDVFYDHLQRADNGDIEGDIAANFASDCVLLTSFGRFEGHDGVRRAADLLGRQLPQGRWHYLQTATTGNVAFLEWTGEGENCALVRDGADSFVIRDGKIEVMTIHYTVETPADSVGRGATSPH